MALSSTDPKVLMGQAKCFACLTPHQQLQAQTYLLAKAGNMDTSAAGVRAMAVASTCYSCLTIVQLRRIKQYLFATWLGLDTSLAGLRAAVKAAACFTCLTPKQQQIVDTYLLAVSAGAGTDVTGVRAIESAAKCFACLDTKQQYEVEVYLLVALSNSTATSSADLLAAAKCYVQCLPFEIEQSLQASLLTQVAGRSTPPCITPTAPFVFTPLANGDTSLGINWKPLTNTGTLITGYIVYWGTTSGVYTNNSGVVGIANRPYIVTGLTAGTTYFFVVVAQTNIPGCVSANSNEVSGTTSGAAPNSLITGLVSYWKMDEGTGLTRNDSIGTNNASDPSTLIAQTALAIIGSAANFAATSVGLQIASNSTLRFGAGVSKSFSGWFLTTSLATKQNIFAKWDDSGGVGTDDEYHLFTNGGTVVFEARKLDNSASVTVTSAVAVVVNKYYHVACGYDDSAQQIWIQVDGETRVTAACAGVRASGVQFRFGSSVNTDAIGNEPLNGDTDEWAMWSRLLTTSEVLKLSASYSLPGIQTNKSAGTDNANRWNTKVQSNGGGAVSGTILTAFGTALDSLISGGVYNRVLQLNPISSDLTAVLTPWSRLGNVLTVWVNHNFVAGDLTINGITGNGTTKYIDTVINPFTAISSANSGGIAIYGKTVAASAAGVHFGCFAPANSGFYCKLDQTGNTNGIIADNGNPTNVAFPGNGFFSFQRVSSTDLRAYWGNSTNPHAQIGATVVAANATAMPNQNAAFMALNNNATIANWVTDTISFIIVFNGGLSSSDDSTVFSAVQTFLTSKGGGFV